MHGRCSTLRPLCANSMGEDSTPLHTKAAAPGAVIDSACLRADLVTYHYRACLIHTLVSDHGSLFCTGGRSTAL
jgi:hypothetical protein